MERWQSIELNLIPNCNFHKHIHTYILIHVLATLHIWPVTQCMTLLQESQLHEAGAPRQRDRSTPYAPCAHSFALPQRSGIQVLSSAKDHFEVRNWSHHPLFIRLAENVHTQIYTSTTTVQGKPEIDMVLLITHTVHGVYQSQGAWTNP